MSGAAAAAAGIPVSGTRTLRRQLRRTERARQWLAFAFMLPAALFLAVNFIVPIGLVLFKSVDDRTVSSVLPRSTGLVREQGGSGVPDEAVFAALAQDIREAREATTLHLAAKRLDADVTGFNALLNKTGRSLARADAVASWREYFLGVDERWGDAEHWAAFRRTAHPVTPIYLLNAFDLTLDGAGELAQVREDQRVYNAVWLRTIYMAGVITLLCVLLGYPLAYMMAQLPTAAANLVMILVLIPFWTSALVRTVAWVVMLQNEGVVNDVGLWTGLWDVRMQLIHNRFGLYVTMCYVFLPFIVLPLYAIMRRIPPSYMRAAKSLGANRFEAFFRIYLPLTWHGVGAGALFVYIISVGYYVTPELVGGPREQFISWFIAHFAGVSLNWGMAAALSAALLVFKAALYWLFHVTFGLGKLKMR